MKLVCPACGATSSPEGLTNDAVAREAMGKIAKLAWPLPGSVLHYLGLFRPQERALTWKKALRLVEEIWALTGAGYVSVQGQIDRNCPPSIWASAMDEMVDRKISIKRPLKNHNYLRQVAWGKADEADRTQEKGDRKNELGGQHIRRQQDEGDELPWEKLIKPGNLLKGVE